MEPYDYKVEKGRRGSKRRKNSKKKNIILFSIFAILMLVVGILIGSKIVTIEKNKANAAAVNENLLTKKEDKNAEDNANTTEDNSEKLKENESNTDENKEASNNSKTKQEIVKSAGTGVTTDNKEVNSENSKQKFVGEKVCYLTFDDGPTKNITPKVLEILKEKDVKATFFVIGKMAEVNSDLIKSEKTEGHVVANHTYSHEYKYLYADTKNLINDFKKCDEVLVKILGEKPSNIVRLPGGSFNKTAFQKATNNAGYHYVDWNSLNGDAEALNIPPERLIKKTKESMVNQKHIVVLMHDAATKSTTVQALPEIIDYIKSQGYVFKTLDEAFDD